MIVATDQEPPMPIDLPESVTSVDVVTLLLSAIAAAAAIWAAWSSHRQARLLARQMGRQDLGVSSAWQRHLFWDGLYVLTLYFENRNDARMEITGIQVVKPRVALIGPAGADLETDGKGNRLPPRRPAPVGQRSMATDLILTHRSGLYHTVAVQGRPANGAPVTLRISYRFSDQRSRLNSITITT